MIKLAMSKRAYLSPSAAHRWMHCPASPWLEARAPQSSSAFIDEGHDAHQLAALCLTEQCDAAAYLGCTMDRGNRVDAAMVQAVQQYVARVRDAACGHTLLVEHEVPLTPFTGEEGAVGTADALILNTQANAEEVQLQVHDLKFGRGALVDARYNEQLALYALGAWHAFGHLVEVKHFRLVIHQPRRTHYSEWVCTLETLQKFAQQVAQAALVAQSIENLSPECLRTYTIAGEKQCRFCRVKGKCAAYKRFMAK